MNITITKFDVEIKPVMRLDIIKAFVVWNFYTSEGRWKITGGTIKNKTFGKNNVSKLIYDAPAYGSRGKFYKVVFIDNLDFFKKLCDYTLEKYCEKTGTVLDIVSNENVNPDGIPI